MIALLAAGDFGIKKTPAIEFGKKNRYFYDLSVGFSVSFLRISSICSGCTMVNVCLRCGVKIKFDNKAKIRNTTCITNLLNYLFIWINNECFFLQIDINENVLEKVNTC